MIGGALCFLTSCGAAAPSLPVSSDDELLSLKTKIKRAETEDKALLEQEETAKLKGEMLQKEIDETEAVVAIQERLLEQERLRAHLVQVVDETKRKAAAEEEVRVRYKGLKTAEARAEVAGVIVERNLALMEIVNLFIDSGLIDEAEASALREKEASIASEKSTWDLAALQYQTEEADAAAHRLVSDAWSRTEGECEIETSKRVSFALKERGIAYVEDELGFWAAKDAQKAIISLLRDMKSLSLIVFSFSPKARIDEIALEQSTQQAQRAGEALIFEGIEKERIRSKGCGRYTPTPLMTQSSSTAFLLVPVPSKK